MNSKIVTKMKKLIDITLVIVSLGSMFFIIMNWFTFGYGWAYFTFHWIISFFLLIIWGLLFIKAKKSRNIFSYLSILLLIASLALDFIWLNRVL